MSLHLCQAVYCVRIQFFDSIKITQGFGNVYDTLNELQNLINVDQPLNLEIGFGGAEHLLHKAASDKEALYIGVEPFLNGVAKALAGIDKSKLDNVFYLSS